MKTREQLEQERRALLGMDFPTRKANIDKWLKDINEIDAQLKSIRVNERLSQINHKYTRTREFARLAFEAEKPTEDITTSDGSFHKTKVKKYLKLAAIEYARGQFKDGRLIELTVNGERFTMYKVVSKYNEPTTYEDFATFEEFLIANNVPCKEITIEVHDVLTSEIKEANEELETAIKNYKIKMERLQAYSYLNWEILRQKPEHLYTYDSNL